MDEVEFYLADLASRFPRNRSDYHLSYSGGKDSHFLYWFIKEYLHDSDIQIVAVNTYMEHPQISARMYKYADIVLLPKMKPMEVKEPETVYDLKYGDEYFFLTESGIVQGGIWRNDYSNFDMERIGNTFLTEEDAKFASERLNVIAELKKYAKEFSDEEWEKMNLPKHYLYFDYEDHVITIGYLRYLKGNDIHFESEEKAQEAIKAVGEDRIKKYYLGVKE